MNRLYLVPGINVGTENEDIIWDTRILAPDLNDGPTGTFSGFDASAPLPLDQIDFIFCDPNIDVQSFKVISSPNDGHHVSDHFPVYPAHTASPGRQVVTHSE